MNKKKAITLIFVFVLLTSTQFACSLSDLIGNGSEEQSQVPPQEDGESQILLGGEIEDNSSNGEQSSQPAADQTSCTKAFWGTVNLSDGEEFQSGDSIQVIFTLVNTGTCTWNPGYSLIKIGGDLTPSSIKLALPGEIAAGESVDLSVEFTAPSQAGLYLSAWKMEDPEGGVFGQNDPPNAPVRITIRSVPSGNPQPNPTPTPPPQTPPAANPDASLEMDGVTLLDDHCYDLNSGVEVDCNDSKADIVYNYSGLGFNMHANANSDFSPNQDNEPDKNDCENSSYAPLPHTILEEKFFCFRIETMTSTTYGWIRIERFDEDGVTFDFLTFKADGPSVTVNTNLFVETQGDQITILKDECFDVQNGEINASCSGIFAGFLYQEVTKKSLQVMQINPNEAYFSAAMSSEPSKSDCQNAIYSSSPIWPIQETSYYCYQFVPSTTAYYGWLRPTSFNSSGMTFDYLTWETSP